MKPGRYGELITHYSVLATLEAAYDLRRDADASKTGPITNIWRASP